MDMWYFAHICVHARSWREFAKCCFAHFPSFFSVHVDTYVTQMGVRGCEIFWEKALQRFKVQCYLCYEGVGVGPISRKKALRNTWMAPKLGNHLYNLVMKS